MLYFLLFARTDAIKKEWEDLLSSFIPEPFHIESALYPDGPVSLLPENLPSCFYLKLAYCFADRHSFFVQLYDLWINTIQFISQFL